jgi:serine phosphatase RsbU (regulator of sigma subunit)
VIYIIAAFYYQQRVIERIIHHDFVNISNNINAVVLNNANANDAIIISIANHIRENEFDINQVDQNFNLIKSYFNIKPSINAIGIVDMAGNEFKLINISENNYVVQAISSNATETKESIYFTDQDNQLHLINSDSKSLIVSPLAAPWCNSLKEFDVDKIFQTDPYLLNYINEYGLSNNLCVTDKSGKKVVIRLEFLLKNLNDFANTFKPSPNGVAVILQKDLKIGGISGIPTQKFIQNDSILYQINTSFLKEEDLLKEIIEGDIVNWTKAGISPQFMSIKRNNKEYFLEAWMAPKNQFYVLILVPATDFIKEEAMLNFLRISNYFIIILLSAIILYYLNGINKKNKIIKKQHGIIKAENDKLQTSISYASKIQASFLTSPDKLSNMFDKVALIYWPLDIIGGDFYWTIMVEIDFGDKKEILDIIVVADCTGHGVPGALISIVGESLLRKIVIDNKIYNPANILKEMDRDFKKIFSNKSEYTSDSIDLSIVLYNTGDSKLFFSGCNTSICIVTDGNCNEVKSSQFLPGLGGLDHHEEFTLVELLLSEDSKVFMFTDGLIDQFGGENGRKWGRKNFKEVLLETSHLPIDKQIEEIKKAFNKWKGNREQTDDVTLLAFIPKVELPEPNISAIEPISENKVEVCRNNKTVTLTVGGNIGIDSFSEKVFETIHLSETEEIDAIIFDFKYLVGTDLEYFESNFAFDARMLNLMYNMHVAIITPIDLFSRISLNRIGQRYFQVALNNIRFFNELSEAENWIEEESES